MDTDPIDKLLTQYPTLKLTDDGQRVKCTLTGHEMPLKPDIIELYVGSKRYTRLLDFNMSPYYHKYKHLFADCTSKKRNRSQLYCKLTKHFVNRTQKHIKKHVEGANFVETYRRWLQHPWPLYGGSPSWPTVKAEAKSPTDADPKTDTDEMSQEMKPAAIVKAESDAATGSMADVLFGGRYYRSIIGEDKEADGGNEGDDDADDDDDDSCSDLYPENDFNEMDTGDSAEQLRNPLKRHVKQKKPKVLGLRAKMSRTDEDYVPL